MKHESVRHPPRWWLLPATLLLPAAADAQPARAPQRTGPEPAWRALPEAEPAGRKGHTGAFVVQDREAMAWPRPAFKENAAAAAGRKHAKVIVVVYDPHLPKHGGKTLTEHFKIDTDPVECSHILANVVREASWGYVNYEIVDVIRVDGFPRKADGFVYDEDTYFQAKESGKWQPSTVSYRGVFEDNGLIDRCRKEQITEVWMWGADGMHFDEFAFYIPNRYARFGPTDNVWLYRPYDIPPELGRTTWVMGFNYFVGADNMIHSYTHRVESMAALAMADGVWETFGRRDPWNVFSFLETDHKGSPSMVGNCHVPPNGQSGYDYNNARSVLSWADAWANYPDLRGVPRKVSSREWGNNQFGYQKWILEKVPKFPGATRFGYNNWWLYIANTDEDLPDLALPKRGEFVLPSGFPAPGPKPKPAG